MYNPSITEGFFYGYSGTATPELPSVGSIPRPLFFVDYFIMFVEWKLKMKKKN